MESRKINPDVEKYLSLPEEQINTRLNTRLAAYLVENKNATGTDIDYEHIVLIDVMEHHFNNVEGGKRKPLDFNMVDALFHLNAYHAGSSFLDNEDNINNRHNAAGVTEDYVVNYVGGLPFHTAKEGDKDLFSVFATIGKKKYGFSLIPSHVDLGKKGTDKEEDPRKKLTACGRILENFKNKLNADVENVNEFSFGTRQDRNKTKDAYILKTIRCRVPFFRKLITSILKLKRQFLKVALTFANQDYKSSVLARDAIMSNNMHFNRDVLNDEQVLAMGVDFISSRAIKSVMKHYPAGKFYKEEIKRMKGHPEKFTVIYATQLICDMKILSLYYDDFVGASKNEESYNNAQRRFEVEFAKCLNVLEPKWGAGKGELLKRMCDVADVAAQVIAKALGKNYEYHKLAGKFTRFTDIKHETTLDKGFGFCYGAGGGDGGKVKIFSKEPWEREVTEENKEEVKKEIFTVTNIPSAISNAKKKFGKASVENLRKILKDDDILKRDAIDRLVEEYKKYIDGQIEILLADKIENKKKLTKKIVNDKVREIDFKFWVKFGKDAEEAGLGEYLGEICGDPEYFEEENMFL